MEDSKDEIVSADLKTYKTFSYKNGNTKLEFTIGVDTKEDLRAFNKLLKMALVDVTKELEK